MKRKYSAFVISGCLICATAFTHAAFALETEVSLGTGFETSDNILQAPINEQDENAARLLGGFKLKEAGQNLEVDTSVDLDYLDYVDNLVADTTFVTIDGAATWMPFPQRFHWVFEDYATQSRIVTTENATPDNLQNTNVFSTGPDFFFRVTGRDQLRLSSRYGLYTFGETDTDDNRTSFATSFLHQLNQTSEVSLNAETTDVTYANDVLNPNYQRHELYGQYKNTLLHSRASLDLGVMQLDRERFEDVDGFLGRLSVTREVTSTSSFRLALESQYTDFGHTILAGNIADASPTQATGVDTQSAVDVFYEERAELGYLLNDSIKSVGANLLLADEDYETSNLDRSYEAINVNGSYHLTTRWVAQLSATLTAYDYSLLHRQDDEALFSMGLGYRLTTDLSLTATLDRNQKDSTDDIQDYDENKGILLLTYQDRLSQ